jgi:hypothetical protein
MATIFSTQKKISNFTVGIQTFFVKYIWEEEQSNMGCDF